MTSSRVERGADAGRDRLLADRDVEEPGQLAGAEAILDLLLEPADERASRGRSRAALLRRRLAPRTRLALRRSSSSGHYADRADAAADQWAQIEETPRRPSGTSLGSRSRPRSAARGGGGGPRPAAAGTLSATSSRFHVTPVGRRPGARAQRSSRRLDRQAHLGHARAARRRSGRARRARAATPAARATSLVEAWDEALATLPPDWSDLLCELELDSSDHLPRAALLGAPMNPTRVPGRDRASLPRVAASRATASRRDGAPLLRAHGRGGDHGSDHGPARALRHGERRHPGPRLARRRSLSDEAGLALADDLRGAAMLSAACGSQRKRERARPCELHLPRLRARVGERLRRAVVARRDEVGVVRSASGRARRPCTCRSSSTSRSCRPLVLSVDREAGPEVSWSFDFDVTGCWPCELGGASAAA